MANLLPEEDSKRFKTANIIAYAALVFVSLMIGVCAYWALSETDVLEIKNSPVPVRTIREHPEADGVVILKVDYCKKIRATGKVRTSFVGESREVFLPVAEDKQPPQCNAGQLQPIEVPVLIPKDLSPGNYHIHFRITYDINPVRNGVVEEFDSQQFEVVAKPDGTKAIPGTPEM